MSTNFLSGSSSPLADPMPAARTPAAAYCGATPLADARVRVLLHELRGPLSAIVVAMEVLRRRHTGDPAVTEAVGCVRRQFALLQELMLEAGASSDPSPPNGRRLETVDVPGCVSHAIELCARSIDARGHRVKLCVAAEPVLWYGRGSHLVRALANLIDNAAQYSRQPGEIRVALHKQGRELVIVVADDGIGLSADGLRSVVAPFARDASGVALNPGGQGIGLALVDEFARRHGGRLVAQSEGEGCGCAFTIRLPLPPALHECDVPGDHR